MNLKKIINNIFKEEPVQKWIYEKCVLCGKKDNNDMGVTYRYKDSKFHFYCLVTELLKLKKVVNKK